jgi:superfamily II DNA or RNA helicase
MAARPKLHGSSTTGCIASIHFAKRDEVLHDLLRPEWDPVIIDEAHKVFGRLALRPARSPRAP